MGQITEQSVASKAHPKPAAVYADKAHRVAILLIGHVALFTSFEMVSAMSENAVLS